MAAERIGEELEEPVEIVGEGAEVTVRRTGAGAGDAGAPAVSFSYCAGWGAVAFGSVERLGVDIEPTGSVRDRVVDRVMAADLRAWVPGGRAGSGDSAATRSWTAGEAIGKAEGGGLATLSRYRDEPGHGLERLRHRYDLAVEDLEIGVTCAIAASRGSGAAEALRRLATSFASD